MLISFSTLYLRYHYFTDVLFAIPLIVFGLYFGGIYTMKPYKRAARRTWNWLRPGDRVQEWGEPLDNYLFRDDEDNYADSDYEGERM